MLLEELAIDVEDEREYAFPAFVNLSCEEETVGGASGGEYGRGMGVAEVGGEVREDGDVKGPPA